MTQGWRERNIADGDQNMSFRTPELWIIDLSIITTLDLALNCSHSVLKTNLGSGQLVTLTQIDEEINIGLKATFSVHVWKLTRADWNSREYWAEKHKPTQQISRKCRLVTVGNKFDSTQVVETWHGWLASPTDENINGPHKSRLWSYCRMTY